LNAQGFSSEKNKLIRFFAIMPLRKPTQEELRFIDFMIREGKGKIHPRWSENLMVAPMDEGGTGSLLLYPDGKINPKRTIGITLFELEFKDADNVPVVASLNLDQEGDLFELDIWKVNFDPLIRLPEL
jgi:hypothetical protein